MNLKSDKHAYISRALSRRRAGGGKRAERNLNVADQSF